VTDDALREEAFWDSLGDQAAIDNTVGVPPYSLEVAANKVCELLPDDEARVRVLDLGCGQGTLMNHLAVRLPDVTFHGVDISARMLGVAAMNSRHLLNTYYWHGNGRTLPSGLGARFYDVIYSIAMFQHIPAHAMWGYILEAKKWLRPGGWLRFTIAQGQNDSFLNHQIDDLDAFREALYAAYGNYLLEVDDDDDEHGWTWVTVRKDS
jgi:trans-aconitate methyltransferase